jgi:hypothetical protein
MESDGVTGPEKEQTRPAGTVWLAALLVTALGTWILFDAKPGVNWLIWTAIAATTLFLFVPRSTASRSTLFTVAGAAILIAGGATVTADEFLNFLIVLSVISYMAMLMLLASNPSWERISPRLAIPAPVVAFGTAIVESIRRGIEALHLVRSNRARAVVGGIAITLPVLIIFALLLASADPVFAGWRDALNRLLASWDFLPRVIFFIALLTIVLGAYGFVAKGEESIGSGISEPPRRFIGETERLILIGGVAGLLWLFLLVQLSYLFGNVPMMTGSKLTFAEYARRGFGELTIVASACVLIILASERYGRRDKRQQTLKALTMVLLVAVLLLLGSAFNRVLLYEDAYGFTTMRLYAQVYMLVVAASLIALGYEVFDDIQTPRLFRRTAAAATIAFIVLLYWNHHAWIATRNIDRLAATGKLDAYYLVGDLSLDAIPVIASRLPTLPPEQQSQILERLRTRYSGRRRMFETSWYEWNLRRGPAKADLERLGIPLDGPRIRISD